MNTVVIHRPLHSDIAVAIKENSQIEQQFMGKDIVQLYFERNTAISLHLGDYVEVFDKKYYLNTAPVIKKLSSNLYEYQCVFESRLYDFSKVAFLDKDATGIHISHEFYLTGQFQDFINVLKNNIERVFMSGVWTFDVDVSNTDTLTLSFTENNCQQALLRICEEFGVEFKYLEITSKPVLFIRDEVTEETTYNFEYGKGKGLYSLTRNSASANNLTTRLYAFGSSRNLGPNYRNYSPRLRLPGAERPILERHRDKDVAEYPFNWIYGYTTAAYVQLQVVENGQYVDYGEIKTGEDFNNSFLLYDHRDRPDFPLPQQFEFKAWNVPGQYYWSDGSSSGIPDSPDYLENEQAIEKYGVVERVVIFDEVYPHREGTVTSVGTNFLQFYDSNMFNLNMVNNEGESIYLLPGLDAKIKFNTGKLAGYEFVISQYKHDIKQFTINPITDERGLRLPHETESEFQIHTGDKYVILDVLLPDEYLITAENELLSKAQAWLEKYSNEQVSYDLSVDQKYVQINGITLSVGNKITVIDQPLGVDNSLRVVELRRNLVHESKYEIKLSDTVFIQSSRLKYLRVGIDKLSLKNSTVEIQQGDSLVLVAPPESNNSEGAVGNVAFDDDYMYLCVTENKWKRAPIMGNW